jgi:hypothetical protein
MIEIGFALRVDEEVRGDAVTDSKPPKAQVQVSLHNTIDTSDHLPLGDNPTEASADPEQH